MMRMSYQIAVTVDGEITTVLTMRTLVSSVLVCSHCTNMKDYHIAFHRY